MTKDLKILFFDLENLHRPEHIFNSGKPGRFAPRPAGFCANLAYILVFGYKWLGDRKARHIKATKKDFEENPLTDETILKEIFEVMNQADIVVTWYGKGHDFPFLTTRLAQQGMYLDQRLKHIDLIEVAKKSLRMSSNRMDAVAEFFGLARKQDIDKVHWANCWAGNYKSLKIMADYCDQDVEVLSQIYNRLLPLIPSMPRSKAVDHPGCPACSSQNVQLRGWRVNKYYKYRRVHCQGCGVWYDGERIPHQ